MSDADIESLRAEVRLLRQTQTRAVSTKQELIRTRDHLDAELRRYKQLADYTRRALPLEDLEAFAALTAEASVELFDVEFGAFVLCEGGRVEAEVIGVCGPPRYRGRTVPAELLDIGGDVRLLDASHPLCEGLELHEAYCAAFGVTDEGQRGVLIGGTRRAKASLTADLPEHLLQSFGMLGLKVDSLFRNFTSRRIIRAANRELEELNKARTQFFANVSHEIRTPLNSIINIPAGLLIDFESESRARCGQGHVFALAKDEVAPPQCPTCGEPLESHVERRFDGDHEELFELLDIVTRNGRYMLALVDDILDASRLAAGGYQLDLQTVDLREVVRSSQAACSGGAEAASVRCVVEDTAEVAIEGDAARLTQIVTNLLGNAIKFSPEGGTVRVSLAATDGQVRLSVRDDGPGIAPEYHAAIFETFRQVPRAGHTEGKKGTGLGLAISRQLAEAHGGTIELDSVPGEGSTFTLVLPGSGAAS